MGHNERLLWLHEDDGLFARLVSGEAPVAAPFLDTGLSPEPTAPGLRRGVANPSSGVAGLVFRGGGHGDLDGLVELRLALAEEVQGRALPRDLVRRGISAVLHAAVPGRYLVACNGERLIGTMLACPEWSETDGLMDYWLKSIYVLPCYRGLGLFSRLLAALLREAEPGIGNVKILLAHYDGGRKAFRAAGLQRLVMDIYAKAIVPRAKSG